MSDNKAVFKRFDDAVSTGDLDRIAKTIDEVFHPDVLISTPLPVEATGAEALKQVWAMLLRAYPDLHVTVEDVIADGDKVVVRNTVTGTHQGTYMGLAPTGKTVTYGEIFILRFVDGRIAQTWGVVDVASQLKQLGLL
ncbi:MAG TPA: ester cyclase [Jatrophihabitantaceae bacterium]|nr:ester cyclase [Jatrophihabitantaceae bacterium]